MTFSYDLNTNVGKVRLYALDYNQSSYVFSDEEWTELIQSSPDQNLYLAAAWGLRIIANDLSRLGRWKDAGVGQDAAANQAIQLALYYEQKAAQESGVSPDGTTTGKPWAGSIYVTEKEKMAARGDLVQPGLKRWRLEDEI